MSLETSASYVEINESNQEALNERQNITPGA